MKKSTFADTIKMNIYYLFIIRYFSAEINPYLIRTFFYSFIISLMLVINTSCKTCKCPAYSEIESKKPANTVDTTELLCHFS